MNRDPLRSLSRGMKEAVEQDPAFVAMTEGNGVVPMSWGNLASQLLELGIVESSAEDSVAAVCEFLSITPEYLRDPRIVISDYSDVQLLRNTLTEKHEKQYRSEHGSSAQHDIKYFLALREGWRVEDGGEKADKLPPVLNEEAKAIDALTDRDEYTARRIALNLLGLEYRALKSGYVLTTADLVRVALSYDSPQYFIQEDVIKALNSTLESIVYDNDLCDSEVLLEDVIIGGNEVGRFIQSLHYTFSRRMRECADAQWQPIESLLMPGSIYNHPLLAGNEK